jgi:hypothetical protein
MSATSKFIFERKMRLLGGGEVLVRASGPTTDFDRDPMIGENCYCLYQIIGIGDEKVRKSWGVDSFQAVHLTLMRIGSSLYTSDESKSGKLAWEAGSVPGDFGFPVPERLMDLLPSGANIV